jgi:hypothetical protein
VTVSATPGPAELTELLGSILHRELGVLEISLGAVHEVFQRLVLDRL